MPTNTSWRTFALSAALGAATLTATTIPAGAASAATTTTAATATATRQTAAVGTGTTTTAARAALLRSRIVAQAAALRGRPYRYGATGPNAFDCSGYTKYVLARVGLRVPRTANQQLRAARRISKTVIQPGDLVFFTSGGYAYHVGIYAGNGMIWHSPKSGSTVRKVKIWTTHWVVGRVV